MPWASAANGRRRLDRYGRGSFGRIDVGNIPFHKPNAEGAENVVKWNAERGQIGFVIPDADAVIRIAINNVTLTSSGPMPISSSLRTAPTALQSPANSAPKTTTRLTLTDRLEKT